MTDRKLIPLGRKIVVAILGTTLLALVVALTLNILPMVYGFRCNTIDRTSAQAELLAASLTASVDFADPDSAQESLATLSMIPNVIGAAVYIDSGAPFATYGVVPAHTPATTLTTEASVSELIVACPIPSAVEGSVVVLAASLAGQWGLMKNAALVALLIFLGVFFLCVRAAGYFRRKLGDPLGELTETIREISHGKEYTRRVDYESDDEVGVMVAEFNSMLDRIELRDAKLIRHKALLEDRVEERTLQLRRKQLELLRNNRLLMEEIKKRANAEMIREEVERINRHDLKSGLSLVIGYPELLLNEGDLNGRQEKHIKRIRAAGYRMLDMIRNQLNIFKMEKGIYTLSTSRVDLIDIICGLEEEFQPLLESVGVNLSVILDGSEVVGDEEFVISGEHPLLRAMFRNLIQNGIEASQSGDTVRVAFDSAGRGVVAISNPAAVPTDIRRRFFDKYVTEGKDNGTGLGTYFAALIARTHGADIAMKTDEKKGTSISVFFRMSDTQTESVNQAAL